MKSTKWSVSQLVLRTGRLAGALSLSAASAFAQQIGAADTNAPTYNKTIAAGTSLDPRSTASPDYEEFLRRHNLVGQFAAEYLRSHASARPLDQQVEDYVNAQLAVHGERWRITPETKDRLFGNVIRASIPDGPPGSVSVLIQGGGGNTFECSDIKGKVELDNTAKNDFNRAGINAPPSQSCASSTR